MRKVLALILLITAAGSSLMAQGEPKPAPTTATVIFYRYRAYAGSARRATINVDGKQLCSLANGRFFKTEIAAGAHVFTGPDKRKGAEATLEAGKTYYFHAVLNLTGAFQVHNVFTVIPVAPEQGQFEVKSLKELDPSDVTKGS